MQTKVKIAKCPHCGKEHNLNFHKMKYPKDQWDLVAFCPESNGQILAKENEKSKNDNDRVILAKVETPVKPKKEAAPEDKDGGNDESA